MGQGLRLRWDTWGPVESSVHAQLAGEEMGDGALSEVLAGRSRARFVARGARHRHLQERRRAILQQDVSSSASGRRFTADASTQTDIHTSGLDDGELHNVVDTALQPFADRLSDMEAQQTMLSQGFEQAESTAACLHRRRSQRDRARLRAHVLQGRLLELRRRVAQLPAGQRQSLLDGYAGDFSSDRVSSASLSAANCVSGGSGGSEESLPSASDPDDDLDHGQKHAQAIHPEDDSNSSSSSSSSLSPFTVELEVQILAMQGLIDLGSFAAAADSTTQDKLNGLLDRAREACASCAEELNENAMSRWRGVLQRALVKAAEDHVEAIRGYIRAQAANAGQTGSLILKALPYESRLQLLDV